MITVQVHLEADLLAALERFIAETGGFASHEEAIQAALRDWAMSHGYLRFDDLDEDTPSEGEG